MDGRRRLRRFFSLVRGVWAIRGEPVGSGRSPRCCRGRPAPEPVSGRPRRPAATGRRWCVAVPDFSATGLGDGMAAVEGAALGEVASQWAPRMAPSRSRSLCCRAAAVLGSRPGRGQVSRETAEGSGGRRRRRTPSGCCRAVRWRTSVIAERARGAGAALIRSNSVDCRKHPSQLTSSPYPASSVGSLGRQSL